MTLLDRAHVRWDVFRDTAQNQLHPRYIDQCLTVLQRYGSPEHRAVQVRPAQLVSDRQWLDSMAAVLRDTMEDTLEIGVIFTPNEDEKRTPITRAVGECTRCGNRVVVDPPFESLEGLWEALNYGEPAEHRCPERKDDEAVRPTHLPDRLPR